MSNTEFISLNEIFVPHIGGDVEGNLEINGVLTVNDGSGEGTFLEVGSDGVFTVNMITARPNEEMSLTTSAAKLPLNSLYSRSGSQTMLTVENGGVKLGKDGKVAVGATVRFENMTDQDMACLYIYRNDTLIATNFSAKASGNHTTVVIPPININATAGAIIYLYASNYSGARGTIAGSTRNFLNVQYID